MITEKFCTNCKELKPINKFGKELRNTSTGLRSWCRKCDYQSANPEKRKATKRAYYQKLKIEAINIYSNGLNKCLCCGESSFYFLCLDHINNDGHKHRKQMSSTSETLYWLKRQGFPKDIGLQVLCFNCNMAKSFNGGVCPHQGKVKN